MIYTVTFNPALDYVVKVQDFTLGAVNRTEEEQIYYGGKGINVSVILKNLGIESVALGFVAGFTGDALQKGVQGLGIRSDFVKLQEGMSRINVKLKSSQESEINGQGPKIHKEELEALYQKLQKLENQDILILAGSIPNSLPEDVYERIMEQLQEKQIRVVVDATKDLLLNVLKYRPFLIKPNNHELGEMFGVELATEDEIIHYARELQKMGAQNVLISMAKDGAILVDQYKQVHRMGVPKGMVKNSVGAGDSMVAGFLAGYLSAGSYEEALRLGTAAGSATAFSEDLAARDQILELYQQLS